MVFQKNNTFSFWYRVVTVSIKLGYWQCHLTWWSLSVGPGHSQQNPRLLVSSINTCHTQTYGTGSGGDERTLFAFLVSLPGNRSLLIFVNLVRWISMKLSIFPYIPLFLLYTFQISVTLCMMESRRFSIDCAPSLWTCLISVFVLLKDPSAFSIWSLCPSLALPGNLSSIILSLLFSFIVFCFSLWSFRWTNVGPNPSSGPLVPLS